MKIIVSAPASKFVNPGVLNLFLHYLRPCPSCGGEEIVLRFGHLPYIWCLSCGRNNNVGSTADYSGSLQPPHTEQRIQDYLNQWGRGGTPWNTNHYYNLALEGPMVFQISLGGEESNNIIVGPVDGNFRSQVEDLIRRLGVR